jgi:predicted kinase
MRPDRPPILVVFSGLPGTSKSTLAEDVPARWPAVLLSVDPIESAMAGVAGGFARGLAACLVAQRVAESSLRVGLDVLVDAVNSVEPARDMWRDVAHRTGESLEVIVCRLDEAEQRRRLDDRDRGLRSDEPDWTDVEARRADWTEWPEPYLRVDASDDQSHSVPAVLEHLSAG